ncbi:peptidoglycan D,D-transpeptidase FtsI family protein [Paenibacillus daejeonensis]|uniref:peptidoglycan D,D-transpeptidase FtsI family protein n=1 Tax=Paenibacillus daejeonensis TaxID=135193 RepID=UPI0003709CD4|nr:penicillin-binding transpeptidase domain-containing protein [Paenibacillus daejeonensis]
MQTEEEHKRESRNRRHFSFRLNMFFFVTFVAFSILIVRLAILQFVEGPELSAREHDNRTRNVLIPPIRGNIYDREGFPVAYSTSTQSLYYTLEPGVKEEQARQMAELLAVEFQAFDPPDKVPATADEIFKLMDISGRLTYVYEPRRLRTGLSTKEIAYFSEHRDQFPGIEIIEESIRHYSTDTIAVQLVGYMKGFNSLYGEKNGLTKYQNIFKNNKMLPAPEQYLDKERVGYEGLELLYQDELRGKNGVKTYPVDSQSRITGPVELTVPEKGNNLYLTIDREVQMKTENGIMEHLAKIRSSSNRREYAPHAKTAYAVAMEVNTGKVVAMASMPDYDTNVWSDGMSQEQYDLLKYYEPNGTIREAYPYYEDPKVGRNHPSSLVPLGSTMKPLTVLLGLNEQLFTPSTTYQDRGYFSFGREGHETRVNNASNAANGSLNAARAISKSSNAFMSAMIGNNLYLNRKNGLDIWHQYMIDFGLGELTGSGLPNESKGVIEYYNEAKTGSAQSALIYASFGQQGRYTALQLAQYTAMLANRGHKMKPQFVEKITDAQGNTIQEFEPEVLSSVDIPDNYWSVVQSGMSNVSVQGFEGFEYDFIRKTGTSQQDVGNRRKLENAVFIAYAPAQNPVLAVAVVVPDGGYGGWGAAPIARKIFDAYDEEIGLTGTPKVKQAQSTEETPEQ